MRLFLLFFLVGIFLILMQTTFLHLMPFGPVIPDLTLVLCVYLGLYHPTVGAALGSFLIGYSVDIVSSRPWQRALAISRRAAAFLSADNRLELLACGAVVVIGGHVLLLRLNA